jgi:predicted helicase
LLSHVAQKDNICLGLGRQGIAVNDPQWSLICASLFPIDANVFRRGGVNIFPIYLYDDDRKKQSDAFIVRRPNFSINFISEFSTRFKLNFIQEGKGDLRKTFGPEDIFHYMYAIFHSPAYRKRYAEFLKIDFPRLPLTSNKKLFNVLCALGEELVGLHLMEKIGPAIAQYPITGANLVEKVRYSEPGQGAPCGRVWINKEQYFENVPPDVWQFHIGGYQVCEKWLKDRKGRTLSYDDLTHYQHIVSALSETIRLMNEIDQCIDQHGGWPIV